MSRGILLVLNNNIQYKLQTHMIYLAKAQKIDSRCAESHLYEETQELILIRQGSVVSLSSTEGCPALTKHFIQPFSFQSHQSLH